MSAIGFVRKALAMGVDLETALKMGEAFEAEMPVYVPPVDEPKADRRRRMDRERKQRLRHPNADNSAAEADKADIPRTSAISADNADNSANRADKSGQTRAPTCERGENNLSRLVDKPNLTTLNASEGAGDDLDWPSEAKPSRAYLDKLEAALRATAGEALDPTATKLFSLAPILALGGNGKGPPCDLQADILPTIRARSARAPPRSVRSWDFYTDAIREARDRRLIGAPETRPVHQGSRHERPNQASAKRLDREDNLARALSGSEAAARSRAFG